MSGHVFDELPMVLTGEADRETVYAVAEHLRGCEDCRQDLVSAVVAHASLSSAAHHAPELAAPGLVQSDPDDRSDGDDDLPDIAAILAQARAEAAAGAVDAESAAEADELAGRRARRNRRASFAAAVVIGALGVGGGLYAARGSNDPTRTVQISAFSFGTTNATAKVSDGEVKLDAASLPKVDDNHYYMVWLTDEQRKSMIALGPLSPSEKGDYDVGSAVMSKYSDVEVSVQALGDGPNYSGISVLRGNFRA